VLLVHAAVFGGAIGDARWKGLTAHLDIGVTIFFLLSGFLLYRPLVAARVLGAPGIRIADYGRRRFLRIVPAYWLALTVLAVFPGLYGVFTGNWWVYYGLLQNYPVYTLSGDCTSDIFRCGIGPAWSLAIEVGFYAVLPFFALAMAALFRRLPRRRWLATELAVLAVLAALSFVIQRAPIDSDLIQWLHFSPLGRAWWFGLGMGLAAFSVWVQERGSEPRALRWLGDRPLVPWGLALLAYAIAALFLFDPVPSLAANVVTAREYLGEYFLFGVIAALILVPAVFGDDRGGLPRRILAHPALAWLGLISYGIFLWHFPILVALVRGGALDWWPAMRFPLLAATTLAITVVCAALSYYLVERPLMRLKYRRREGSVPAAISGRNQTLPVESRGR